MKRLLSLMLSLCLVLSLITLPNASAATYGSCGSDVTWRFDDDTGTLTISGTGPMRNYEGRTQAPWIDLREKITSLVVEEGVTSIGDYAFAWTGSTVMLGDGSFSVISAPDPRRACSFRAPWNPSAAVPSISATA